MVLEKQHGERYGVRSRMFVCLGRRLTDANHIML